MNVRMRIWAGFAAVAALTALLGAFSVAGFMSSSKALNELAEMNGDAQLAGASSRPSEGEAEEGTKGRRAWLRA